MLHPCTHVLYLTSELSCEYFQCTHWLLIWPDADEGDLMDEEFDSEPDT